MIITRANDRALPITAGDWVQNGDRWTVAAVHADGSLAVIQTPTRRRVTLPGAYVSEHVQLGYAITVHGAQGITAEACQSCSAAPSPASCSTWRCPRGRNANHVYLATVGDGDPHSIVTPAAVSPPSATGLLSGILARDGAQTSATGAHEALLDPAEQLHSAANRYADALRFAANYRLGAETAEILETAAERLCTGLTSAAAWPALRGHLALLALTGEEPVAVLRTAVEARELQTASDPAAVLDWRLPMPGSAGPLPWLPGIPAALAADPHWGSYLTARAGHLAACAAPVAAATSGMTAATAPVWAQYLLAPDYAPLRAELGVWRAALAVPDNDRRPTEAPRPPATERRHQARLDQAVIAAGPARDSSVWAALADGIDPRIPGDKHWPVLNDRLAAATHAGLMPPACSPPWLPCGRCPMTCRPRPSGNGWHPISLRRQLPPGQVRPCRTLTGAPVSRLCHPTRTSARVGQPRMARSRRRRRHRDSGGLVRRRPADRRSRRSSTRGDRQRDWAG